MTQVHTEFTSDSDDLMRAYKKQAEAQAKELENLKQVASASKAAYEEASKQLKLVTNQQDKLAKAHDTEIAKLRQVANVSKESAEKSKAAYDELKKKMKEVGDEQEKAFGAGLVGKITTAAAGYITLSTALQAVNGELQRKRDLEKGASEAFSDVAEAHRASMVNLGPVSDAERARAMAFSKQTSVETGIPLRDVYMAESEAFSARGDLKPEEAQQAVRVAGRVTKDPSGLTALSAGLMDVPALTGTTDPMQNLGFLTAVQSFSRTKRNESISQFMVPAAIGVQAHGGSAQDAMALITAIGNSSKDPEGRVSSTAALQLAKQLGKMFPDKSTAEAIGVLQNDPKMAKRFLDKASFEAKPEPFIRDMILNKDSPTARDYARIQRDLPTPTEAGKQGQALIAAIGRETVQTVDTAKRSGDRSIEMGNLSNPRGALTGNINADIDKLMSQSGEGYIGGVGRNFSAWLHESLGGEDRNDIQMRDLRKRVRELRRGTPLIGGGEAPASQERLDAAKVLDDYYQDQQKALGRISRGVEVVSPLGETARFGGLRAEAPTPGYAAPANNARNADTQQLANGMTTMVQLQKEANAIATRQLEAAQSRKPSPVPMTDGGEPR